MIKKLCQDKLKGFVVDKVIISNPTSDATCGYVEIHKDKKLDPPFQVGFVFFPPNHVSLTMSQEEIEIQFNLFYKKHYEDVSNH